MSQTKASLSITHGPRMNTGCAPSKRTPCPISTTGSGEGELAAKIEKDCGVRRWEEANLTSGPRWRIWQSFDDGTDEGHHGILHCPRSLSLGAGLNATASSSHSGRLYPCRPSPPKPRAGSLRDEYPVHPGKNDRPRSRTWCRNQVHR